MNIQATINKLLLGLEQKNKLFKINSFQFYSENSNKYITKYQILKRRYKKRYNPDLDTHENVEEWKVDKECYSKIDILTYFAEEYEKVSDKNGK